jgi:hypothetical protein
MIDVTGGYDAALELPFPTQPENPASRESMNMWIWDSTLQFGLPRMGVEAVGEQWETHDLQFNLAFADGRVFNIVGPGANHVGNAKLLGAGPMSIEVIEPYQLIKVKVDGEAHSTSVTEQIDGAFPGTGELVPVHLDVELRPAAPPWMNGDLLDDAKRVLDTQEEGGLMGHPWRFEQLCRATGMLRIGDEEHRIDGGANRIRRQGIRQLATFWGHAWQAALFPSGRGFGYITYPERKDGKDTYNEGYIFEGDGELLPATVVQAPWLEKLEASGESVPCVLETAKGTVTIEGTTVASTFMVMPPEVGGGMRLQQAITRYTWDGESTGGMLERSMPGLA